MTTQDLSTTDGEQADGARPAAGSSDAPPGGGRTRRWLVGPAAALVLAAVVVLTVLQLERPDPGPAPAPTTITLPVPTPAIDPVERDTSTPLLTALPGTVLGYAVVDQVADVPLSGLGALEAWQLTYSGADEPVVLHVGQWATPEEAAAAMAAVVGSVDPSTVTVNREETVLAGGSPAGTLVIRTADGGAAQAMWTNGTVLFVADGPPTSVDDFYDAYPL